MAFNKSDEVLVHHVVVPDVQIPEDGHFGLSPRAFLDGFKQGDDLRQGLFLGSVSREGIDENGNAFFKYFEKILPDPAPGYHENPEKILAEYNIRIEHTGETMENLLKIFYIKKHYPNVALFVQTSPAFCCPSLVTEAMAKEIEKKTGVPIVSITYDGTSASGNEAIIPYLTYLKKPLAGHH